MVLIGFFVFEMIQGYFIGSVLSKENNYHAMTYAIVITRGYLDKYKSDYDVTERRE